MIQKKLIYKQALCHDVEKMEVEKSRPLDAVAKMRALADAVSAEFVGRDVESQLAVTALASSANLVFIGEPGVAKSSLIRSLASKIDGGRFFYYLMTKYTTPDELLGPIDPIAFKNGTFKRMHGSWMPDSNIVFLDELFKASSATLNALLNAMNERMIVDFDGSVIDIPAISIFSASNEIPQSSDLRALYDRFAIKAFVNPISTDLIPKTVRLNVNKAREKRTVVSIDDIMMAKKAVQDYLRQNADSVADSIGEVVSLLRGEGISVSDRMAVGVDENIGYFPAVVSAYSLIFDQTPRKAAIIMARYLVDDPSAMGTFEKAIETLYPKELTIAQEKIEEATAALGAGELKKAKELAYESMNMLQDLIKSGKFDLYRNEIEMMVKREESIMEAIKQTQSIIDKAAKK
ncbi:hypothetical protein DMB44_04150 [Thermoplasma sp. Kam2015]|nr:hypothetical protein DMB44_04150 [Thermoplasma sp. Kam2015]